MNYFVRDLHYEATFIRKCFFGDQYCQYVKCYNELKRELTVRIGGVY